MDQANQKRNASHFWRYTLIGLLTIAPLWVTWLVFEFVLSRLSRAGSPGVGAFARVVRPWSSPLADLLLQPWFHFVLAIAVTLLSLYFAGWFATRVIGRRLIGVMESVLTRIPLASAIYNATKRFITAMREQPSGLQRVVFISFPSADMMTVGLVTKIMRDEQTGREIAAVYVPTSPNPTSGYIELVPLDRVTETDWTVEEAMRFIMTGGTNARDVVRFGRLPDPAQPPAGTGAARPPAAPDRSQTGPDPVRTGAVAPASATKGAAPP